MNRKPFISIFVTLTLIFLIFQKPLAGSAVTLKELAEKRGIRIGGNYDYELRSETHDKIFEEEFNALTVFFGAEVNYPGGSREPVFSETDELVLWATTLGMEVLGQTLVWFEDIPAWGKSTPLDQIEAAMFKHIDTLVGRYAGRVKLWNVVNEAIDDEGMIRLDHRWAEAMGADYISKAFIRAHAADPTAVLYYNEYDIESNTIKYNAVKALLKDLLNKGVPVHALGWQMHVKPGSFDPTTLLARFNEIADMGLDNYITELDVELPADASEADYEQQKQTYKTIVKTFLAARRHKTLVIWGLRDGSPYWLTNGHPLLFDEKFRKKPAYFGVQEALKASSVPELSSKFDLWKKPSFFRGAAVHPYTPYGEEEGRIYITKQDLQSLRARGANVVSLNYPGPFQVSPPYEIDEEALKYLDNAINWAGEVGLYVIIHFRNGPGKSEETFYGEEGREDERIWYSEEAKAKWVQMWQFVAQRYKDKPHIVGYNLMVEPHPEDTVKQKPLNVEVWIKLVKRITTSLRKVDKDTPIIIGATVWSNPIAFADLKPTGDERTIYSFHMYEPYEFTHQGLEWAGKGQSAKLTYPGMIPSDIYEETRYWNKALIEEFLQPILTFRDENKVPIFVGEFGCNRRIPSCAAYLKDLLEIFEENSFSYTHYIWNIDDDFDYQKEVSSDARVGESQYMRLFKKYWGKNKFINLQ